METIYLIGKSLVLETIAQWVRVHILESIFWVKVLPSPLTRSVTSGKNSSLCLRFLIFNVVMLIASV